MKNFAKRQIQPLEEVAFYDGFNKTALAKAGKNTTFGCISLRELFLLPSGKYYQATAQVIFYDGFSKTAAKDLLELTV